MLPFAIAYIITLFCVYIDSRNRNNFVYYILAPLPLLLLVAFRDVTVGTDTQEYTNIYDWTNHCNNLIQFLGYTRIEPLYAALTYIVSSSGGTVQMLFFISACLSIYPILIGIRKKRNDLSQTFAMFLFLMMFFHYSMNITRQAIAMAFLFLAMINMQEMKYAKTYGLIVIAMLFHYVAIVGVPIVLLYQFRSNFSKAKIFGLVIVSVGIIYFILPYMNLEATFTQYNDTYFSEGRGGMQTSYTIEMFLNLILVYAYTKKNELSSNSIYFFRITSLYIVFLNFCSIISSQVFRLALFMDILSILFISEIFTSPKISKNRSMKKKFYVLFAVVFWLFVFVINHSGDTVPYTSQILGVE